MCNSSCVPNGLVQLNDFYNPLATPLLNGWTRCVSVCVRVSVCLSVCARMCMCTCVHLQEISC